MINKIIHIRELTFLVKFWVHVGVKVGQVLDRGC